MEVETNTYIRKSQKTLSHSQMSGFFYLEDFIRTIQMTLDDGLVASIDEVVKKLKTTR
ncbi:MAG: hypothetical protein HYV59_12235 [Planctomycetes bacterium]|nr:hypothetical protein [Planctomycetota bacterium]